VSFKEFYEARHGKFPGELGQTYDSIFKNMCNAVADYVDEKIEKLRKELKND
jgi:uncharacterized protein YydD (DUF2326 family)